MEQKIGSAWDHYFDGVDKPKYNLALNAKDVEKLQANDKGEIKVALIRNENASEKAPTHSIVVNDYKKGEEQSVKPEQFFNLKKEDVLKQPVHDGKIYLDGLAKRQESIGQDKADYWVASKDKENRVGLGRGWSIDNVIQEKKVYVGNAYLNKLEGADQAHSFNISLDRSKIEKLEANKYNELRFSMSAKREPGAGGTHAVFVSRGKEPFVDASFAVKKEDVLAIQPNDKGYTNLSTVNKNIGKNYSDAMVVENKGPESKNEKLNIVGDVWTHNPKLIRVKQSELTPEGLSLAIANNHVVKGNAIISLKPSVVRKSHLGIAEEKVKNDERLDKSLHTRLKNEYDQLNAHKKTKGMTV